MHRRRVREPPNPTDSGPLLDRHPSPPTVCPRGHRVCRDGSRGVERTDRGQMVPGRRSRGGWAGETMRGLPRGQIILWLRAHRRPPSPTVNPAQRRSPPPPLPACHAPLRNRPGRLSRRTPLLVPELAAWTPSGPQARKYRTKLSTSFPNTFYLFAYRVPAAYHEPTMHSPSELSRQKRFGRIIKERRDELGLTQLQIGDLGDLQRRPSGRSRTARRRSACTR